MSLLAVNTVDRLDRPSAYFGGKVSSIDSAAAARKPAWRRTRLKDRPQNKRRRYNEEEEQQQEKPDDKLKNATTLYVGNLYAVMFQLASLHVPLLTKLSSFYTTEEQIHELFAK